MTSIIRGLVSSTISFSLQNNSIPFFNERSSSSLFPFRLSGVFAGLCATFMRVMLLFLFESNEMSYFDGLEKVYSVDLIYKLICRL
jgi:H+/Cl- antiporter ClcA